MQLSPPPPPIAMCGGGLHVFDGGCVFQWRLRDLHGGCVQGWAIALSLKIAHFKERQ